MAQSTVQIEVKVAWWVRWYLSAVALCCKLTGLEPDVQKVLATAERGITVATKPSLRRRIAAAYQRSGWARLGVIAAADAVALLGMTCIWLAPASVHAVAPVAMVLWVLLVATVTAWAVFPQ